MIDLVTAKPERDGFSWHLPVIDNPPQPPTQSYLNIFSFVLMYVQTCLTVCIWIGLIYAEAFSHQRKQNCFRSEMICLPWVYSSYRSSQTDIEHVLPSTLHQICVWLQRTSTLTPVVEKKTSTINSYSRILPYRCSHLYLWYLTINFLLVHSSSSYASLEIKQQWLNSIIQ